MDVSLDLVVSLIGQYGYAALFFLLWLGIIGLPVPDELIVAAGGFGASLGILDPFYAFLCDYLGVISGLTIGYGIGRLAGRPALVWLARKKRAGRYIKRSLRLIRRYGSYSLCISYLFPVIRHIAPYIVASGGMPFRRYALISYTTGLVWTAVFYGIGYLFGRHLEGMIGLARTYGYYGMALAMLVLAAAWMVRFAVSVSAPARRSGVERWRGRD